MLSMEGALRLARFSIEAVTALVAVVAANAAVARALFAYSCSGGRPRWLARLDDGGYYAIRRLDVLSSVAANAWARDDVETWNGKP